MNAGSQLYREADPTRRLIVALDAGDADATLKLADRLRPHVRYVKVGMELFTAVGPSIVARLRGLGMRVFLDLKFHDIPATVAGGVREASRLGAWFTTIHAGGGAAMVRAAAKAAADPNRDLEPRPVALLGVTVLTSLGENELPSLFDSRASTAQLVQRLGGEAIQNGATGLVASPLECGALRQQLGPDPLLVIPGIRPQGTDLQDQSRVATPTAALGAGADFLVIGRPITRADDPTDACRGILDEMAAAR